VELEKPVELVKLVEPVAGTVEADSECGMPDKVELDTGGDGGAELDKTGDTLPPILELRDVGSGPLVVLYADEMNPLLELVTNEGVCAKLLERMEDETRLLGPLETSDWVSW